MEISANGNPELTEPPRHSHSVAPDEKKISQFVAQIVCIPPRRFRAGFGDARGMILPRLRGVSRGEVAMSTKAPNPVDKYVGSRVRMRRIMLGMSQEKLGEALGLTFQQVQKYEKGTNRVGASRIQQISEILQIPVSFLFEGGPSGTASAENFGEGTSPAYVSDFLATTEGLALTRAFTRIADAKLRRSIVDLVEQIAAREAPDKR
jgi:transcriptional regulator with XRE-family HTH domain